MSASLIEQAPVGQQLQSLTTLVRQLQQEVCELRRENAELCQQVSELRCEVGYWKSMHARAVERNTTLKAELDEAQAEIRQLKAERFGKQSEKRSAIDRSNHLEDPEAQATPKNKRGQQPGRPAPKRRDYSHLPEREELIDVPGDAKICDCCGKPLEGLGHGDASEQIEIETTVYRRVIRRKRYRRTCDCDRRQRTVTAPLPPKLLPKSIYGSGSEWSGRLAMMLFSVFATLALWKINPRKWLNYYFAACAANGGKAPANPASFLPWNLAEDRLAELRSSTNSESYPDTS